MEHTLCLCVLCPEECGSSKDGSTASVKDHTNLSDLTHDTCYVQLIVPVACNLTKLLVTRTCMCNNSGGACPTANGELVIAHHNLAA